MRIDMWEGVAQRSVARHGRGGGRWLTRGQGARRHGRRAPISQRSGNLPVLGAGQSDHKAMHEVSVQWSNAFDSGRWRAIGLSARTTHPAKLSKSWAELAASLWASGKKGIVFAGVPDGKGQLRLVLPR